MFEHIFLGIIILVQVWYWFIYFPKAWRDKSNLEIENLRSAGRIWLKHYKG